MAVSSSEFRSRARQKLNAHYWDALLAVIVEGALLSVGSPVAIIIGGAFVIGLASFFLHNADRQNADITDLFAPFSKQFGNSIVYFILSSVFISLWSCLFVIPGIVAAISYSMAPYILAEHPEMSAMNAIKLSKDMMLGNKGRYFCLQLSFIGWILLSLLTFGIGMLFLIPYMQAANAEFFNEVSGKNAQRGTFDPAEGYDNSGFNPGMNTPGGFDNFNNQ